MDAGLHLGNIKSKQSRGRQTPWVTPGARPGGGRSCHPILFQQLLCRGTAEGLNLTNLKSIKLGNTVEDFGNAMYWRGGAATPPSPVSSTQAGLKPGSIAGGKGKPSSHVAPWGHRCGEKRLQHNTRTKKTKREEVLWFWQGFNFLFWLLLAVWYHTLVSSSGSSWKSWSPTKSLGIFLWWPSLITKNSLHLAEIL